MELEWIKQLRQQTKKEFIGDDAAVIDLKGQTVLTVDMLTEGVDFLLSEHCTKRIGRKALAVNLSDIAAMGAIPTAVLIALALPKNPSNGLGVLELAEQLYTGMKPLLEKYHVDLIGGDTNSWDGGLVLSITALGRTISKGPLRRNGAKAGDAILVTGPLGGSLLRHQFDFEPRIFESLYLNEHHEIHAAIDISDGLSLDLHRLATESRLGAILDAEAIPITSDAVEMSKISGKLPLQHALSDGEDFELLLAVPENEAKLLIEKQPLKDRYGTTLYRIGTLTGENDFLLEESGVRIPLIPEGFQHGP